MHRPIVASFRSHPQKFFETQPVLQQQSRCIEPPHLVINVLNLLGLLNDLRREHLIQGGNIPHAALHLFHVCAGAEQLLLQSCILSI